MNRRISRTARVALSATLIASAGLTTTGCAHYRANPTPGLDSLNISRTQNRNNLALVRDTNLRALRNDLARFWFLDRPTRLTKQPMPY